ncbi:hypothetical protein C8R44DRAFT_873550 [Mycena epipterygia]|nr:hypothetical protein C8R44DRAFT_873550 [Mycena epipterygia]
MLVPLHCPCRISCTPSLPHPIASSAVGHVSSSTGPYFPSPSSHVRRIGPLHCYRFLSHPARLLSHPFWRTAGPDVDRGCRDDASRQRAWRRELRVLPIRAVHGTSVPPFHVTSPRCAVRITVVGHLRTQVIATIRVRICVFTHKEVHRSSGAFVSNSSNFTISGGNFTNIVNNAAVVPSDFRTIPLGDVDLRNEIHLEHSGVVNRQRGLRPARRVYTARIEGKQSDMTVAVYQGENAEETWKRELSKYSGLRHPNFVQLYASVNSDGLYATIFHDDLVPLKQFVDEYRHSVISTVYLYDCFIAELRINILSLLSGDLAGLALTLYLGYGIQLVDSVLKLHPISPKWRSHIYQ